MACGVELELPTKAPHVIVVASDPFATEFAHQFWSLFKSVRQHPAANAVPRLEYGDRPSLLRQSMTGRKSSKARSDDETSAASISCSTVHL